MNDDQVVAEELNTDPMDNFDFRLPSEVEAAEESEALEAPEVEDTTEKEELAPETTEEVATPEEAKPYVLPQRIKLESRAFEATIPVDEYGNIDPEKMQEYLQNFSETVKHNATVDAQNAYFDQVYGQREWADVEENYGELLKTVPSARQTIESLRIADAVQGGDGSLMNAAKQLSELRGTSIQEGKASQQSSIERQKSVSLKSSSRSSNTSADTTASLRKAAFNGGPRSEDARIAYIQHLSDTGKL